MLNRRYTRESTAEADRGHHPRFTGFNGLAVGPSSLALALGRRSLASARSKGGASTQMGVGEALLVAGPTRHRPPTFFAGN